MSYKELISYDDKVNLYSNSNIPAENKVQDTDMNNIKNVVNGVINGTNVMGNIVVDSIKSKNMIPSEISSQSISGLTITRYNDGSFKIHGTSTASISRLWIFQGKNIFVKAGTYTLSTHSTGTVNDTVYFVLRNSLDQEMPLTINVKNANSRTNTFNDDVAIMNGYLYIGNNITFNNFVIYPQLEEGNSVSNYATYQNLDGKEYYSAEEIVIGTWIDGKPLYRKVITRTVNANTNDSVALSTLGISNQDVVIINVGMSTAHYQISTIGGGYAPIIYYVSNTDRAHVYLGGNKELQIQNQNNAQREYNIVLEYTKSTD